VGETPEHLSVDDSPSAMTTTTSSSGGISTVGGRPLPPLLLLLTVMTAWLPSRRRTALVLVPLQLSLVVAGVEHFGQFRRLPVSFVDR